jgi:hypothetical protein
MVGTSILLSSSRRYRAYIGKKTTMTDRKTCSSAGYPKNSLIERDQIFPDIQGNQ